MMKVMADSAQLGDLDIGAGSSTPAPVEQTAQLMADGMELKERLLSSEVLKAQLLRLAMRGLNATDASKVVGCCAETARSYYRDPDFRLAALKKVNAAFEGVDGALFNKQKNLHEMLEEQALKSCQELIEMVDNPELHPSLKVKIHQDFLNRVEDSAPQSRHSYKVEPAELKHAAQVAREMDNVLPFKKQANR